MDGGGEVITDDTLKRVRDALMLDVRSRLRDGFTTRDTRLELEAEVGEAVKRELMRQIDITNTAITAVTEAP